MKCKLLSGFLALMLLFTLLPVLPAGAARSSTDIPYAVTGGNIYFDKETGTITDCDETVTRADIPSEIDGIAVTAIGWSAFYDCDSLTAVTIPNSVTTIGNRAFEDCTSLTAVTIPDDVTAISEMAFSGCTSLTAVTIPDSVTEVGWYAFSDCSSLTSVTIPGSVTEIGGNAFYRCSSLTSVTISEGVTTISKGAFDYCSALTSITIPASVESIYWAGDAEMGETVFAGCTSLQSISVAEDNPRYYNDSVGALFDRDLYANNLGVPDDAPQNINALLWYPAGRTGAYQVPKGVTYIFDNAFLNCTGLTAIDLSDVTSIGRFAFSGCTGLTSVTIPDSVAEINCGAFYNCTGLSTINFRAGELSSYTYLGYWILSGEGGAIFKGAFDGCTNLKAFTVSDDNPSLSCDESGALFNKNKTLLLRLPEGYSGTYQVPESVTEIGHGAFSDCSGLTSVTIPEGVTTIDDYAFTSCSNIKSVNIPNSVTYISNGAFYNCTNLTAVYFRGNAPELGRIVFYTYNYNYDNNYYAGVIPGLTLYYIEGKAGWTTPTWNDYPTATWDGKADNPTPDDPKPDDPKPDDPSMPTFNDVPENAWFAGAVDYAVENGLMNGMGNNEFQPNTSMTRAMLVTVLWRYADSPKKGENTFTDVPAGKYYTDAVAWAAANGIVNGVGDGKFNPDGNITREQLVTILYRYCQKLDIDTSKADDLTGFPDAGNVGNSAKDAMRWAVAEKLIGGKSLDASGTVYLQPKGSAIRAEVATILMRFIENILKK